MKTQQDVHEQERERIAGESLDDLKKSVDTFLHSSLEQPRADDAEYRQKCHEQLDHILTWDRRRKLHAALDRIYDSVQRRRSCAGDRGWGRR
jgi:hypothetical protein